MTTAVTEERVTPEPVPERAPTPEGMYLMRVTRKHREFDIHEEVIVNRIRAEGMIQQRVAELIEIGRAQEEASDPEPEQAAGAVDDTPEEKEAETPEPEQKAADEAERAVTEPPERTVAQPEKRKPASRSGKAKKKAEG